MAITTNTAILESPAQRLDRVDHEQQVLDMRLTDLASHIGWCEATISQLVELLDDLCTAAAHPYPAVRNDQIKRVRQALGAIVYPADCEENILSSPI